LKVNLPFFALFYSVFEGNFPSTRPREAHIWRGDLTEGFLRYRFGALIFGGAYTWRGLFSEFYGMWYVAAFERGSGERGWGKGKGESVFHSLFFHFSTCHTNYWDSRVERGS